MNVMEDEMFVSGFCKAQNQTRMVECIFELRSDGSKELTETDCAYGVCPHSESCQLIRNAKDI